MENLNPNHLLYLAQVEKWAQKINLVSIHDLPHLKERHLKDSLTAAPRIPVGSRVLDVGSGNGFPVIPLAIERGDCHFVAVEPREKRVVFLNNVKRQLQLENLDICCDRIENREEEWKNSFDVALSRAFKDIITFVEIVRPFLKKGGMVIAFNELLNNDLLKIKQMEGMEIENVDNYVYNLGDGKKRVLASFRLS